MKLVSKLVLYLLLGIAPLSSYAADCRAVVRAVIAATHEACGGLENNSVCYGDGVLNAAFRSDETFTLAGDSAPLGALQTLVLMPFAAATNEYGMIVLRPRAIRPDSALSLVVFGDVSLQNASDKSSDFIALPVYVRTVEGANVRAAPSPTAALVAQLTSKQTAVAVGRLKDSSWILLTNGWVAADLLTSDADLTLLEIVPPDAPIPSDWTYAPMQAFTLRTGINDAPCTGTPDSGALLQTPDSVTNQPMMVNGIAFTFTGTLYLQASSGGALIVSILEGAFQYSESPDFPAGRRLQLRLNDSAVEQLVAPEDYFYSRVRYAPLSLLPREVDLPFSLGGLLTPFVPGTGFLANVQPTDPCVLAWNVDVNVRAGPGMEYPIRQGIPANFAARPDGLANGTDGVIWWRLAEAIWLRSGLATVAGDCLDLPQVEVPPVPQK